MSTIAVLALLVFTRIAQPLLPTAEPDPIEAILNRDWAAVGGWSLFIGLCMFFVLGAFREWWVPGGRYRRQEEALKASLELTKQQSNQIDSLIQGNEITKHFFEEYGRAMARTPRIHRPAVQDDEDSDTGGDL